MGCVGVMRMFPYEKLEVWQESRKLVRQIYSLTRQFPQEEKYGLVSQINRAAISVASNIAEGSCRSSLKDQAHFSQLAFSSLMELSCQLTLAADLQLLSSGDYATHYSEIKLLANRLNALKRSQLDRQTQR